MKSSVYAVTFDCGDAAKLAQSWSQVLDRTVGDDATGDFAAIGLHDDASARPHLMSIKVSDGKAARNRVTDPEGNEFDVVADR